QIGIRRVLSHHTYSKRLHQITEKIGFDLNEHVPSVTFLSFIKDYDMAEKAKATFKRLNYENKNLIIIVDEGIADYSILAENITVVSKFNIIEFFMTLNQIIDAEFVAILNLDDYYGENYLKDLLLATLYTDSHIIGKNNFYVNQYGVLKEMHQKNEHE